MEYVDFGKTGRKVSRLGFGGAPAGLKNYLHEYDPQEKEQRKKVIEAIEKALQLSVNYFDTAPGYGNGQSEEIFGEALQGVKSDEIFIATKVGFAGKKGDLRASIEKSLKRLKRDSIDLIQLHGTSYDALKADSILKDGGILDEMLDAKREGLVKFIGFTTEDNNRAIYDFMDTGKFDAIQICYNLLFQHPYDPIRPFGTLFEADKKGMGISAMRPTTSGLFQKWITTVNPENTFDYTKSLIQFTFSNPLVDVVLVGMRSAERVLQNVEICNDIQGRINIKKMFEYYV
jgi:aryl-alcohol dehydrogenase-like predicted oxidoreductase